MSVPGTYIKIYTKYKSLGLQILMISEIDVIIKNEL